MDVMLQRHCAKYIYVVPDGLKELTSDISREVLRSQPTDLYLFIADYLDALMITRENARVAAKAVESITTIGITIAELLERTGMAREEVDRVARIIQTAFRKHLTERAELRQKLEAVSETGEGEFISEVLDQAALPQEHLEQAAFIIQKAYRLYKERKDTQKGILKGMIDWRVAARSTMRLYRKTEVTIEEANRAASLIKAAYKGYYTRRAMKKLLEESEETSEIAGELEQEMEEPYTFSYKGYEETLEEITEQNQEITSPLSEEKTTIATDIIDRTLKQIIPSLTSLSVIESLDEETSSLFKDASPAEGEATPVDDFRTEVIKAPDDSIEQSSTATDTEDTITESQTTYMSTTAEELTEQSDA